MYIDYFKSLLEKHEDVVLHFKKKPPLAVTCNLTTPYIKERIKKLPEEKDKVTCWCWTTNRIIVVDPKDIKFVEPLSSILDNKDID